MVLNVRYNHTILYRTPHNRAATDGTTSSKDVKQDGSMAAQKASTEEARLPTDDANNASKSKKERDEDEGASQDKSTKKKETATTRKTVVEVIQRRHGDVRSTKDTKTGSVVVPSSSRPKTVDVADGGSEKRKSEVCTPKRKSEVITGDWKCSSCLEMQSALLRVCLHCCTARTSEDVEAARDRSSSSADEHSTIARDGWGGGVNEHFLNLKETRTEWNMVEEHRVSPDKDFNFNLKGKDFNFNLKSVLGYPDT
jgi:hypothetical protein